MTWDVTLDFEYVVTKKAQPKLCFGTTLPRETLPSEGPALTPFMRRNLPANFKNLGPGAHDVPNREAFYDISQRKYSRRGLGSKAPRWVVKHEFQPPPKPPLQMKPMKQNCAPFNSTYMREARRTRDYFPAPCDYVPKYKKKVMPFIYCFSSKKVLKCPVQIKCVPYNLDECGVCGCSCSAQGDYWHFENRIFLCREHYNRLFKHCLSKYQGIKLTEFKSVRDCFFAHAHNSCKASLKIMSPQEITKKLRKEAYLDLFYPQRRFCDN